MFYEYINRLRDGLSVNVASFFTKFFFSPRRESTCPWSCGCGTPGFLVSSILGGCRSFCCCTTAFAVCLEKELSLRKTLLRFFGKRPLFLPRNMPGSKNNICVCATSSRGHKQFLRLTRPTLKRHLGDAGVSLAVAS